MDSNPVWVLRWPMLMILFALARLGAGNRPRVLVQVKRSRGARVFALIHSCIRKHGFRDQFGVKRSRGARVFQRFHGAPEVIRRHTSTNSSSSRRGGIMDSLMMRNTLTGSSYHQSNPGNGYIYLLYSLESTGNTSDRGPPLSKTCEPRSPRVSNPHHAPTPGL